MSPTDRCYSSAELPGLLKMPRSTFFELKAKGKLTFLEELRPRIGRRARYRADLIDRWLANQWTRPQAVPSRAAAR